MIQWSDPQVRWLNKLVVQIMGLLVENCDLFGNHYFNLRSLACAAVVSASSEARWPPNEPPSCWWNPLLTPQGMLWKRGACSVRSWEFIKRDEVLGKVTGRTWPPVDLRVASRQSELLTPPLTLNRKFSPPFPQLSHFQGRSFERATCCGDYMDAIHVRPSLKPLYKLENSGG